MQAKHYQLSKSIFSEVKNRLLKKDLKNFVDDPRNPLHFIVLIGGIRYSVYCGGFKKFISVKRLTSTGMPDRRTKEKSFSTPKQVTNYFVKLSNRGN